MTDTATPPDGPWIEHTGDGTLVHDTARDDDVIRQALKAAGFRWSRNLGAWYLPRTWTYPTRTTRGRQLVDALERQGRTIRVEETRERQRSSEAIETERVERAEARAERLDARAERRSAESDARYAQSKARADRIPFGQPILVDHHSYASDVRFREKIRAGFEKSIVLQREADEASRRADSARSTATKNEDPRLIARRIKRLEADRRRTGRSIDGTDSPWSSPATGKELERLQADADDLDEQIEWNRKILADAEEARGRLWAQADLRVGDEVRIGGTWYPVKRVNKKTVSVPPLLDLGADAHRSWTDTVPYDEIRGRRRDGEELTTPPPPAD